MTKKPGQPSATPAPRRNPVVLAVDIIAALVILAFTFTLALVTVFYANQYPALQEDCGAGPYSGLTCNGAALTTIVALMNVLAIAATVAAIGMFVVQLVRRRLIFVWPLIAFVVLIAVFYGGTALVALTQAPGVTP